MVLLKFFSRLPFPVLYRLSDILYYLLFYIIKYRSKTVYNNLKNSFPEKPEKEIRNLTKAYYRNLSDLIVETIKSYNISEEELRKRVKQVNIELLISYLNKKQTIIALSGHQCNWEWLLQCSCIHLPYSVDAVYRPLHNNTADKFFLKLRTKFGAHPVPALDTLREVIRRKNITKVIAMVADQAPPGGEIQYWTKFLNQDSAFFVGADKLAKKFKYPVFMAEMTRIKRGYYEIRYELLAEPPFTDEKNDIIELYSKKLEESIKKYPADWLWSHMRWKHKRNGE
ncbi:MAG: lysophospholipid acyltransferase family protein [Cytophagaceae bacterium]